jgi:hypothetical protein
MTYKMCPMFEYVQLVKKDVISLGSPLTNPAL